MNKIDRKFNKPVRSIKARTWYKYESGGAPLGVKLGTIYVIRVSHNDNVSFVLEERRDDPIKSHVEILLDIGDLYEVPPLEAILLGEVKCPTTVITSS